MLELPKPIRLNRFIRPAKLANECDIPHAGKQDVVLAGMGRHKLRVPNFERRLREAKFVTLAAESENCSNHHGILMDPDTIICALANFNNNQTVGDGDSGSFDWKSINYIRSCLD